MPCLLNYLFNTGGLTRELCLLYELNDKSNL